MDVCEGIRVAIVERVEVTDSDESPEGNEEAEMTLVADAVRLVSTEIEAIAEARAVVDTAAEFDGSAEIIAVRDAAGDCDVVRTADGDTDADSDAQLGDAATDTVSRCDVRAEEDKNGVSVGTPEAAEDFEAEGHAEIVDIAVRVLLSAAVKVNEADVMDECEGTAVIVGIIDMEALCVVDADSDETTLRVEVATEDKVDVAEDDGSREPRDVAVRAGEKVSAAEADISAEPVTICEGAGDVEAHWLAFAEIDAIAEAFEDTLDAIDADAVRELTRDELGRVETVSMLDADTDAVATDDIREESEEAGVEVGNGDLAADTLSEIVGCPDTEMRGEFDRADEAEKCFDESADEDSMPDGETVVRVVTEERREKLATGDCVVDRDIRAEDETEGDGVSDREATGERDALGLRDGTNDAELTPEVDGDREALREPDTDAVEVCELP
jgi:hypothetical protein